LRRELGLPPASALAALSGPGAAQLAAQLAAAVGATELAPERWLLRAPDHRTLCDALADTEHPKERVDIVVDPTDL